MLSPDGDPSKQSVTLLLQRFTNGDKQAEGELLAEIYPELRRIAHRCMSRERAQHTLQPTALIHEAYLRLAGQDDPFQNRTHFLAVAARVMRQVLVDHARARIADKRGGGMDQITLEEPLVAGSPHTLEILFVHEALEELERLDARQARIVELHFFGGLTMEEIARVVHLSERTTKRDWSMARAWLKMKLTSRP